MKLSYILFLIFTYLISLNHVAYGQPIAIDTSKTEVIIKDSAKVGVLVTSKGNILNVTQNFGQSQKFNKKYEKVEIDKVENFDFLYSKKFFSWGCNWNHDKIKREISFYFEDDNQIDSFSRIIIQLDELNQDSSSFKYREFYVPQKDENLMTVTLRKLKTPFKITCGLILKEDENRNVIKVYSQHCVYFN